jgi:DNA primase catalytic core
MARISDDDLQRLKKNISLADLCRSRGIELKPHGRKDLIGKCPFHEDKKPSFVVSPDKNVFHCMGCDAGGSVVDFVMKADNLPFKDAVDKLLSAFPGICRASDLPTIEPTRQTVPLERAAVLLEKVIATYERTFAEVDSAKVYLEKRGITDAGLFSRHRVGYANGRLKELLPKDGTVWNELKAIGVLLDNGQERFKDCVVFPVFDAEGQITTLYARYLGDGPKRHLFLPERSTGLWNAIAIKTYSEIILVESVIDALSVMMAGHPNVIAIQGTNGLNDKEIALLKTYGVQKVTLLLDGDEAGGKAAARLRPRLEAVSLAVTVKALPVEHDPNSYLVKHGAEKLAEFLASAAWTPGEMKPKDLNTAEIGPESSDLSTGSAALRACPEPGRRTGSDGKPTPPSVQRGHVACHASSVVTYGMRRYEIRGLEKGPRKLRATIRVEHGGKLHVDTLDFYSAKCRRVFAMDLCRLFEEVPETIEADIEKIIRHCETMPEGKDEGGNLKPEPEKTMTATERKEADEFGKSPDLFELILKDFETCGLVGEENNKLLGYLAMTSRKRDVPLSVLILSSSGAGKTALQDTVVSFCPPEDLVKLTSLSGKALFYKERLSLKNKVLALEEGDGAEEASYAIRNLISAKELVSESTIKDLATGRLVTMENKVEGPSSVFLTTTNPEVDPETKSRFFVTSVDESREQTRRILLFQRQLHQSDGLITSPEIEAILKKHRNFQRLLKPLAVKNPYAAQLTYGDDRLQGRRDQPKYLNLIKAIAFLRQMTKPVKYENRNGSAVPYIEVDRDDIRLANKLAHEILGHSLDELSRPGRDLLLLLDEMVKEIIQKHQKEDNDHAPSRTAISFSRREIREHTGWTNTRLHIHLKELVDMEYVIVETGRNGSLFRYRLAWEGQGKDGRRFMLGLTDPEKLQ